jgi:hypothetical protein
MEIAPESQEQFGYSDQDENHANKTKCDSRSTVARRGSSGPQFAVRRGVAQLSTKKRFQFDSAILVKLHDFIEIRQKQNTSDQIKSAEKEAVVKHCHFNRNCNPSSDVSSRRRSSMYNS